MLSALERFLMKRAAEINQLKQMSAGDLTKAIGQKGKDAIIQSKDLIKENPRISAGLFGGGAATGAMLSGEDEEEELERRLREYYGGGY
jgi:hypothetical protein